MSAAKRWVGIVVLLLQMVALVLLPFGLYGKALTTDFADRSPTQYGALVLCLLTAGLASTSLSYFSILLREAGRVTRTLVLVGAVGCGVLLGRAWTTASADPLGFEHELDILAMWVLLFVGIAAVASAGEWYRNRKSKPREWRVSFIAVDLPLFLGCLVVVAFKHLFEDRAGEAYIDLLLRNFPSPGRGFDPEWFSGQGKIHGIIRSNFWTGFTAGAISVQLATAQVATVTTRIVQYFLPDQGEEDGSLTVSPAAPPLGGEPDSPGA